MAYFINGLPLIDSQNNVIATSVNVIGSIGRATAQNASFQGTVAGFVTGGQNVTGPVVNYLLDIERFSFASDSTISNVGSFSGGKAEHGANSSTTHGYLCGGRGAGGSVVQKFPFATTTTGSSVFNLTVFRYGMSSQSSSNHGYNCGGTNGISTYNLIDKFPFSVDSVATDVGDITAGPTPETKYQIGNSSTSHGYSVGGGDFPTQQRNIIEKFPFATDANATDVGDMIQSLYSYTCIGQSSQSHGYVTSTSPGPGSSASIRKFSFVTDGNSSNVGLLTVGRQAGTGISSTVSGYTCGGFISDYSNIVDKFSFVTDGNAVDVGDLVAVKYAAGGTQD